MCDGCRLECQVRAYPLPAITWHVNGVELTPSPRFVQTVVGEQIVLEIREVTRDDAGIYTCRARNTIGEASTSTALIVSGTPSIHQPIVALNVYENAPTPIRLMASFQVKC